MAPALVAAHPRAWFEAAAARWWRPALLIAATLLGLAARVTYGRGMPLWFDETFTGVIAGQATIRGLTHWLLTEASGPLYYAPMWLWARVAGISTEALRLPSLLCTLAAPLFVLRWGHRDATMRVVWAAVLLLWLPAAVFAGDARPYAQLVLLGTLQTAAFCTVMRRPGQGAALGWVLATVAMGLTHYVALWPGLVQGVMLLAVHRRAALVLWPAALPFAVLAGWMAVHLPFVAALAAGGMVSPATLALHDLARMPGVVIGDDRFALLLALPLGWALVEQLRGGVGRLGADGWTGLAGVIAMVGLFGLGCVVPGVALRYFTPSMPALLFGVAHVVAAGIRRASMAAPACLVAMIVATTGLVASGARDRAIDQRHAFSMDLASRWLGERPVPRVVFFWADLAPLAPALDRNIADVGGFFLRRGGQAVTVDVVHVAAGGNAAAAIAARANAAPGAVILGVGNAPGVDRHRWPGPLFHDARWTCRDFGQGLAISFACRPR